MYSSGINLKGNAMAPRIIQAEVRQPMDETEAAFKQYVSIKRQIDDLTKAQNVIKPQLMEYVDLHGDTDDKGHVFFNFPQPIDGYAAMQRQRRVSFGYDEDAAMRILHEKGLYDRCMVMKPVLDEDAVMDCLYRGLLTEDDIDAMRPQKVTYAFVPVKA